ncbi:MAG: peptidoglycan-binding protein [Actinomycetota bacterium]
MSDAREGPMSVTDDAAPVPADEPTHGDRLPLPHSGQPIIDVGAEAAASGRRRVLLAVVAVAVLAAVIGFVAGSRLQSSSDARASAEAPPASLITVPVERREISSTVVVRGDVRFAESTEISVAGSVDADVNPVVTRIGPVVDDVIGEGAVLLEVGGRPVFLLEGDLPTFRDLRPGQSGDDVAQLQEALRRLGHLSGTADGEFGSSTEEAISAFYTASGYVAPGLTDDEEEQLRAARDAVDGARSSLRSAEQIFQQEAGGPSQAERLQLDAAVADAEAVVAVARRSTDEALAESRAARAEAETARDQAKVDVAEAEAATATARDRLAQAQAGTDPDTGQPPTAEALAALETAVADAEQAEAELRGDLDRAEIALVEADAALRRAEEPVLPELRAAETNLAIARATRDEALAPVDRSGAQQGVDDARAALDRAQADLTRIEAETGVVMPQSELVFLPELPRRVESVAVERGDAVQGPVMTVSGVELIIDSGVSAADRPLLAEGAAVVMDDPGLGLELEGEIDFLARSPGTGGVGENRYEMRIRPVGEIPPEARGVNFRITIPVSSTGGEVLAVPLAALSSAADGTARVEVDVGDGTTRIVPVSVGLSAGGFAEIEPLEGQLDEGDRVVVGAEGVDTSGEPDDEDEPEGDEPESDEPEGDEEEPVDEPEGGSEPDDA